MTFTCIIIDDEPIAHAVLKDHISKFPDLEIKGCFFNAEKADSYISNSPVDLIFLDIAMPGKSGIDFLGALKNKPVTIFTTAYRQYAFEGFELGVIDYLVKPIEFSRFDIAVKRATDFIRLSKTEHLIDFDINNIETNYSICIKSGIKKIVIDYRTIVFAQGLKDYTILHAGDKKYVVRGTVKFFEDLLPATYFMRVHKSFIVAKNKIRVVVKTKIEIDNIKIPIGRFYKSLVDEYIDSFN